MTTNGRAKKNAQCNTCTLKLVSIAYRRAPWFRLCREPLKSGMRFLSFLYRVNPAECGVRTPHCFGCIRFYKAALKEKSGLFRRMHDLVNPRFDAILERIVTAEEIKQAKTYARAASSGEVEPAEAEEWMAGQHKGFGKNEERK